jgi:hypothetical protein
MIQQRIMGKVSDGEYSKFKNDLKRIADDSEKLQLASKPMGVA